MYFFIQLIRMVKSDKDRGYDTIFIVQHALSALGVLLLKLKWVAKRELFMATKISN